MRTYFFDNTRDENGHFITGYRMSKGRKYITIEYLTNWEGDRDKTYKLALDKFTTAEAALDLIKCGNLEPAKIGEPIR